MSFNRDALINWNIIIYPKRCFTDIWITEMFWISILSRLLSLDWKFLEKSIRPLLRHVIQSRSFYKLKHHDIHENDILMLFWLTVMFYIPKNPFLNFDWNFLEKSIRPVLRHVIQRKGIDKLEHHNIDI